MVAYTDSYGFAKNSAAFAAKGGDRLSYLEVKLDFAKIVAARSAASVTALSAADTLQVLQIPAGFVALQGGIEVSSAETTNTTATFDVGFTGGSPAAANVFGNDVASNSTGITATGLAAPLLISSADTLDLLLNTAVPANAVVYVWLLGFNANHS